jgi:hypothetical protein
MLDRKRKKGSDNEWQKLRSVLLSSVHSFACASTPAISIVQPIEASGAIVCQQSIFLPTMLPPQNQQA